jgi:hypothetical protein
VPNASTIAVNDAAATPVSHTFNKVKVQGDTAYFMEQSNASALGHWPLVLTQRSPLAGQTEKVARTKISLSRPIVQTETINGIGRPLLMYTLRSVLEHIVPTAASLQERKDQHTLFSNVQLNVSVKDMVENQLCFT